MPPRGVITRGYQPLFSRKCAPFGMLSFSPALGKNAAISGLACRIRPRMRNEREFRFLFGSSSPFMVNAPGKVSLKHGARSFSRAEAGESSAELGAEELFRRI